MNSLRHFFSQRLIWLALLLSVGIGAMVARTVWTMRSDEWDFAARTNRNLVTALEQSLDWTLGAMDQSLQDVAAKLRKQGALRVRARRLTSRAQSETVRAGEGRLVRSFGLMPARHARQNCTAGVVRCFAWVE